MTLQFGSRSTLFEGGYTEEGDRIIRASAYVVARAPDGSQWAHDYAFVGHPGATDELEAKADALAQRIAAAHLAGAKLDPAHWDEIDPAYGSDAYQSLDRGGYFRELEIRAAIDAGEPVNWSQR